jgi:hypothetical protein
MFRLGRGSDFYEPVLAIFLSIRSFTRQSFMNFVTYESGAIVFLLFKKERYDWDDKL